MQPHAPYYAVIFTSRLKADDPAYHEMGTKMVERVQTMPGYLGMDSARSPEGLGITVSYWQDLDSIKHWKQDAEHSEARRQGREDWYSYYKLRICRVESEYGFGLEGE